jgi:surface antigen
MASYLTDPATGKQYEQLPGAKAGRELTGTLSGTTSGTQERTLPSPTAPTIPQGLPNTQGGSSLTNFTAAMKEMSRIAYANKPTNQELLGRYSAAGVPLTTPGAIQGAISADTGQRAGRIMDVYNNTLSLIKDQEEARQKAQEQNMEFGRQMLATVISNPALFSGLTGQEFEELKNGNVSTELIQKLTQAAQTSAPEKPITQEIGGNLYQLNPQTGQWDLAIEGQGNVKFEQIKDKEGNVIGTFDPTTGSSNYYQGMAGGGKVEYVGGVPQVNFETQNKIDLVTNLLGDPNLKDITGFGGTWAGRPLAAITGANRDAVAKFDQIKNLVSLEGRQQLKGTGQISDFEAKMLADAETSLRRNLSDPEAKRVLGNIQMAFQISALAPMGEMMGYSREEIKKAIEQKGYDSIKATLQSAGASYGGGGFNNDLTVSLNQSFPQGSTGGQCTTWLHKVADFPHIGDGKTQKFAAVDKVGFKFNEQPPQIGDIIVTNENKTYGHTAMIIGFNQDGTATLAESNYAAPNKVTYTRKISLNSPRIYGAIRPSGLKIG